jgi:hypothetical protein
LRAAYYLAGYKHADDGPKVKLYKCFYSVLETKCLNTELK